MVSRRLGPASSSTITLTSHSSTYLPPSPSPLRRSPSPLGVFPTSLDFLSSTSSSVLQGLKKKRTRRSLAEEQELHRIMDPTYLGSSSHSSSRWKHIYYSDPEGYWHDIDYKPFSRINENLQRSWTSFSSSFCPNPTPSASLSSSYLDNLQPHPATKTSTKSSKSQGPLPYWETFTVLPYTTTTTTTHLNGNDNDEEKSKYSYSTWPTRYSPSHYYYSYPNSTEPSIVKIDGLVDDEGEGNDKRRVLLKKDLKRSKKENNGDSFYSSKDTSTFSPGESLSSSSLEMEEGIRKKDPKDECKSLTSKTEKFHKRWVITTFIARLKVIRTKRWLRERVVLYT